MRCAAKAKQLKLADPDPRDESRKNEFMQALQLRPSPVGKEVPKLVRPSSPLLIADPEDLKSAKKCGDFIRSNPIEFSSLFGRKMLSKVGKAVKEDKASNLKKFSYLEKYGHLKSYVKSFSSRKYNKMYLHTLSFSRRQRLLRATELATGLSRKSWSNLNKCKQVRVAVDRISEHTLKKYRLKRLQSKVKSCKPLVVVIKADIMSTPWILKMIKKKATKHSEDEDAEFVKITDTEPMVLPTQLKSG